MLELFKKDKINKEYIPQLLHTESAAAYDSVNV